MSALRASRVAFLLVAGLLLSCSSFAGPYVRVVEPLALPDEPRIYVIANRDSQRVVDSLEASGLAVGGLRRANLLLRVYFGGDRRNTSDCGQVRNLKYELRSERRLVIGIRGRGPTGRCGKNIVDQASAELARLLGD